MAKILVFIKNELISVKDYFATSFKGFKILDYIKKIPHGTYKIFPWLIIGLIFFFVFKGWILDKYHNWFQNKKPDLHYDQPKVDYKADRVWAKCIIKNAPEDGIINCLNQYGDSPGWILCIYDTVPKEKADKCDKESQ